MGLKIPENSCCNARPLAYGVNQPREKRMKASMKNVSEYIAAGSTATGFVLIESPVRETEKALGFECVKFNACGNPYNGISWVAKSQIATVNNDYYTSGPKVMFLCPNWLYRKSFAGGEVLV